MSAELGTSAFLANSYVTLTELFIPVHLSCSDYDVLLVQTMKIVR